MARSRNIKPGLYLNEMLAGCSLMARFIFPGLWTQADRSGRLEDRPLRLKAALLPYDNADMNALLNELQAAGFIERYMVGNERYIQVTNFEKHQNPHCREPESTIPAPGEHRACTIPAPGEHRTGPADSLLLIPDSLNPITATSPAGDQMSCPAERIVEAYHVAMQTNPRCKVLNAARRGMIKARWNEAAKLACKPFGYSTVEDGVAAWTVFFETCAQSEFLTGRVAPQPGKPPFLADIDFLMSPKGFAGCLENKYHREAA